MNTDITDYLQYDDVLHCSYVYSKPAFLKVVCWMYSKWDIS